MNILIKVNVLGKINTTWKDDKGVEHPSHKLNYQQENGLIVGQLSVPEDIFNSVETGKDYILEGSYGVSKNGGYLRVTNIHIPK